MTALISNSSWGPIAATVATMAVSSLAILACRMGNCFRRATAPAPRAEAPPLVNQVQEATPPVHANKPVTDEFSAAASLPPSHDDENNNHQEKIFSKPPEELTWDDLERISTIKRKGKEGLSNRRLTNLERREEQKRIDGCKSVINSVEILRDLRSVRKYIQMRQEERKSDPQNRNPTWPNERTDQAIARIIPILRNTERHEEALLDIDTFTRADWKEAKRVLWQGLQEARQTDLKAHTITWLTGTNSASIPLIKEVAIRKIVDQPSLVPSGTLLENDIIPLCGELERGIYPNGVNINNLSGVSIPGIQTALNYAWAPDFFNRDRSSIERIFSLNPCSDWGLLEKGQISLHRLLMLGVDKDLRARLQIHIQTVASNYLDIDPEWESNIFYAGMSPPEGLGHNPKANEIISVGTLVVYEGCIYPVSASSMKNDVLKYHIKNLERNLLAKIPKEELRILSKTDLAQLQKPEQPNIPLKNEMRYSIAPIKYGREINEKMLALFDRVIPIDFGEVDLIEEPFPIIWGSQTLNPTPFNGGKEGELIVEGVAPMGEQIQWAFTTEDKIKRLEQSVSKLGLRVLSFSALQILLNYPQRMKAGTDPLDILPLSPFSSSEF